MINAHVSDQYVLQLTYHLAVQLTLSLGGQLTLETFLIFLKFLYPTQLVAECIMFLTRPSVSQSVRQSCFSC